MRRHALPQPAPDGSPMHKRQVRRIEHVFHLARSSGPTWDDYLRLDVEPTRHLADTTRSGVGLYSGTIPTTSLNPTDGFGAPWYC